MPVTREYVAERTKTEECALEYAAELQLVNLTGRGCPACGSEMRTEKREARRNTDRRWRCSKRDCRQTRGIFWDTVFDGMHLSLRQALGLLYGYCEKRKHSDLEAEQGMTRRTVARWFGKLKHWGSPVWRQDYNTEDNPAGERFTMLVELLRKGRMPPTEVSSSLDGCKYSDIFSSTRSMDGFTSTPESVLSDRKDCE